MAITCTHSLNTHSSSNAYGNRSTSGFSHSSTCTPCLPRDHKALAQERERQQREKQEEAAQRKRELVKQKQLEQERLAQEAKEKEEQEAAKVASEAATASKPKSKSKRKRRIFKPSFQGYACLPCFRCVYTNYIM